jgi:hypothetical protein
MDLSLDLFLTHDPADLRLLGGHVKFLSYDDPETNFEGDVDPRMLTAELTGNSSQMNDAITEGGLDYDPIMQQDPLDTRLNLSQVLSLDIGDYNALNGQLGEMDPSVFRLQYNGLEMLKVGGKTYECYNLTFAPGQEDMTFWYSPQFPAMPLKYIRPHEDTPLVFRVVEFQ